MDWGWLDWTDLPIGPGDENEKLLVCSDRFPWCRVWNRLFVTHDGVVVIVQWPEIDD